MVTHHSTTDEEQLSELKDFVRKYWKLILVILVIGLFAVWGWRYWQTQNHAQLEQSSDTYEALLVKLNPNNPDSVKELVAFSESEDNTYGVFAALKAAQFYIEELKDYAGAQALLENAEKKTKEESVLAIIYTRIARLQYQQGLNQESLQTLDKVHSDSWSSVVNDIRGDVLVKLERYADANRAYQTALDAQPVPELAANIQMKLNETLYLQEKQAAEIAKQDSAQATQAATDQSLQVESQADAGNVTTSDADNSAQQAQ